MKIKKTFIYTVLFLSIMILAEQSVLALEYGDKAPAIEVSKWFKNKPEEYLKKIKEGKNDSIVVLCIWATWSETTDKIFGFLNTEVGIYGKENVIFIALSKENERIVDRFVRTNEGLRFSVATDVDSKTYDKYMINTDGVPMFFIIGRDGDVIWKGGPSEVDRILSSVLTKTFDNKKEVEIKKIRDDLQKSIQYMNFERQNEVAQRILDIDPIDQMAINIIVDNYIRRNEIDKAVKFMLKKIDLANYNKYVARVLYFNLLGVIQGMNDVEGHKYLLEATKRFYVAFKNEPNAINSYCIALVQSMPMEIVPLKEVYDMMNTAIEFLKEHYPEDKENLGLYYRTLAKVYYMIGNPGRAVESQEESVDLLKKSKNDNNDLSYLINQGELLLKHYKTIKKLQETLK